MAKEPDSLHALKLTLPSDRLLESPHMASLGWTLLMVCLVAIGITVHHNIAQH